MTHKEILQMLTAADLSFVLIGGTAMRLYSSPRVTHDIDLAIRTLDIDRVLPLMYSRNYRLISGLTEETITLLSTPEEAHRWIEKQKPGSLSFVYPRQEAAGEVPLTQIDPSSQVDFLFELPLPLPLLTRRARRFSLADTSFLVASPEDLIRLKEARQDRGPSDNEDIRYLRDLLQNHSDTPSSQGDPAP